MNCYKISRKFFNFTKSSLLFDRHNSYINQKLKTSYNFMPGYAPLLSSTVSQILDETTDKFGDDIAFVSAQQGISKTYSQFRHEVQKLASGFVSCGLKKGDRIAICSPNSYEWPLIQFAAAKSGLVLVNINPASQPKELEYYLKKVGCKALVVWDYLKTQNFYEILCQIISELPTENPNKFKNSSLPDLEMVIMISKERKDGVLNFEDVSASGNKESDFLLSKIEKLIQFDDPVNVQFTSGTTGFPKGSVLSHHNVVNNTWVSGRRLGYDLKKPIICCQVPLFHCFGCVIGTLMSVTFGGTCVFPCIGYDPSESLKTIEKFKCSIVYGTPTMYVDLLNSFRSHKCNISSLKQAIVGGAPASETLATEVRDVLGVSNVANAYGSTENSPVVALNGKNDEFTHCAKGMFQPIEYVECKITDFEGNLLPINTRGELCVKGHNVFIGYWDDAQKTSEVVSKTNWYSTGDLATMDEDGFIKIVGRKKDMIIRGGENIFPLEIENFLFTHPAIIEVQIVGVPDERMGEELCAWISIKEGMNLTGDEVKQYCKGKLSHFKIPRYIMFVKDFPKTQSGKIQKFEIVRISTEKLKL